MNAMRFVDTNVLLYSISTVPTEAAKAMQAQSLMTCQDIVISVQVLQEFYVQAARFLQQAAFGRLFLLFPGGGRSRRARCRETAACLCNSRGRQ